MNTSASLSLSNISVKIGAKTYTGEEAKNLLLARVKAMKDTKNTTEEKQKFLEQFNTKLSKLAWIYEKKDGKALDIAKVLRAVEMGLKSEITSDNGGQTTTSNTMASPVTETGFNTSAVSNNIWVGGNVNTGYESMARLAKTPIQWEYVDILFATLSKAPSIWWKDETTAINYMINYRFSSDYKSWPVIMKLLITKAVKDWMAGRTSDKDIIEAFKTLPKDFSEDTGVVIQTTTTKSTTPSNIWVGGNVNTWYEDMIKLAKIPTQIFYVNVLFETLSCSPSIWWKDETTAINYMKNLHLVSYNKYPKTVEILIKQAVKDWIAGRTSDKAIIEAFKTLPTELK